MTQLKRNLLYDGCYKKGKTSDSAAPSIEEILDSDRLRFFNIYKRAFNGDLEAMKICLEFCEEKVNYRNNR